MSKTIISVQTIRKLVLSHCFWYSHHLLPQLRPDSIQLSIHFLVVTSKMKLSTIAAAITAPITLAYASRYQTEAFVLFGAQDSTGNYPNYTLGPLVVDAFPLTLSKSFILFFLSFFLSFCFWESPPILIIATNIICYQRIRWRSRSLKLLLNLTMIVLSSAPMASIRLWARLRSSIPHRPRSLCNVQARTFLDITLVGSLVIGTCAAVVGCGFRVCWCCWFVWWLVNAELRFWTHSLGLLDESWNIFEIESGCFGGISGAPSLGITGFSFVNCLTLAW